MLQYRSTRHANESCSPSMAILNGLAPDGGLYVPEDLEVLRLDYREVLKEDYLGMARIIFAKFFPDLAEEIPAIVEASYRGRFRSEAVTPLVPADGKWILELFHGPTCAFKDVALSALPNLMAAAVRKNHFEDEILILTATSGDTGSAALHGFSDVPGTRIVVFYPDEGISLTQRLQMTTERGRNTAACAIRGDFDDAQRGVKEIFRTMPHPAKGIALSSANSINIGRLVPQVVYYFAAYRQLMDAGRIAVGDPVTFVVPTGNFGDIMAGWFARAMGLPVEKLVCASNSNEVLADFLATGRYDRKRILHKTNSPSMDILVSSNLERLLYFVCGEEQTRRYMEELGEKGAYEVSSAELESIRACFVGGAASDEEGAKAIHDIFSSDHYLMDTHTAVAWAVSEKLEERGILSEAPQVILSTASPYKFTRSVLAALGEEVSEEDRRNMERLEEVSGVAMPEPLAGIFDREVMHRDVIDPPAMKEYVKAQAEGR